MLLGGFFNPPRVKFYILEFVLKLLDMIEMRMSERFLKFYRSTKKLSFFSYVTGENSFFPVCQVCENQMGHVLQIETKNLWFYEGDKKFLHLFYCHNSVCDEFGSMDDQSADNFQFVLSESSLSGLIESYDKFIKDDYGILLKTEREDKNQPFAGGKIGGTPAYLQEESFSHCGKCKNNYHMKWVFQFELLETVEFPFPRDAMAYVSRCEKHNDQFGFIWQCD